MRMRRAWASIAAPMLLTCGGCGFKGPLYLPEHNTTVVTHPASSASAEGQAPAGKAKGKGKGKVPAPRAQSPPPP